MLFARKEVISDQEASFRGQRLSLGDYSTEYKGKIDRRCDCSIEDARGVGKSMMSSYLAAYCLREVNKNVHPDGSSSHVSGQIIRWGDSGIHLP